VHRLIAVTRALGDESRVRILEALRAGELCVCQIVAMLGLAPSTVSRHLALLRDAGLVEARKQGRWVYYRLVAAGSAPKLVRSALRLVHEALEGDVTARDDAARLGEILALDPEILCCEQRSETTAAGRRARGGRGTPRPENPGGKR